MMLVALRFSPGWRQGVTLWIFSSVFCPQTVSILPLSPICVSWLAQGAKEGPRAPPSQQQQSLSWLEDAPAPGEQRVHAGPGSSDQCTSAAGMPLISLGDISLISETPSDGNSAFYPVLPLSILPKALSRCCQESPQCSLNSSRAA